MSGEAPTAERPSSVPPGKDQAGSGAGDAVGKLRAKRDQVVAGDKRGPGRPKGSGNKSKDGKLVEGEVVPPEQRESMQKKVGMGFRAVGHILALSTNCNVWVVAPEEEKLLGEALGDICADLGIADSLAVKAIFAAGVVGAVFGTKALQYSAYLAWVAEQEEAVKKGKTPAPPPVPPAPPKGAAPQIAPQPQAPAKPQEPAPVPQLSTKDPAIHETRPGLL